MALLGGINLKNFIKSTKEKINDIHKKIIGSFNKKRTLAVSVFFIIMLAIPFSKASAASPWDYAKGLIETVLFAGPYIILWIFTGIAVIFVAIATFLVDSALTPGIYMSVINSAGVDRGWTIMRDTANLFFILILIFIALATTLRLQSYSAKTWVPKLLFAAIFINFSKVITMFIIDIGNMFMYGIISWMGGGIEGTGIRQLNLVAAKLFLEINPLSAIWNNVGITLTALVQVFAALLFNVFLALTLFGFGILLLIRVSMLAILTIFSPIAFMLHAWPNAGKYAGQWWSALLKYIVFGPIIVFFLYIAGEMATTMFAMGLLTPAPTDTIGTVNLGSFSYFFANLIPYVVVIIMLLAGLSFTSEMGVYGAGLISGTVKGLGLAAGAAVGYSAGKSLISRAQKGEGFIKGGWNAYKNGTLKQYGREALRGKPVYTFGGGHAYKGAWDRTKEVAGGMLNNEGKIIKGAITQPFKDTAAAYTMARNAASMKAIKGFVAQYALMSLTKDQLVKKLDSNNSREENAALIEHLSAKKVTDPEHLKTIEKHIDGASGTAMDKKKVMEAFPELTGRLKGIKDPKEQEKENFKQLSEMYDEGALNRLAPASYSKNVLKWMDQIMPDPKEVDRHLEHRGKAVREVATQNYIEMFKDTEDMKYGLDPNIDETTAKRLGFDPTEATKRAKTNHDRASRVIKMHENIDKMPGYDDTKGYIDNIFKKYNPATGTQMAGVDKEAVKRFTQDNYQDLGYLDDKDLIALVEHNGIDHTTAARIHPTHLNPYKAKLIWEEVQKHKSDPAYKDVHKYMAASPMWGKK